MDKIIIRKSATIRIKIKGGKVPIVELSSYSSLSTSDSNMMTNEERKNYINSEALMIENSYVFISELMNSFSELIKKEINIKEIPQFSILLK